MNFTKDQQKTGIAIAILVALVAGVYTLRSNDPTNAITAIAKGPEEQKVVFCAENSGVMPSPGTYTQYNRCIDYLALVAQGLIDPNETPPPGTTPTTTIAPSTTVSQSPQVYGTTPCPPAEVDPNAVRKTYFQNAPMMCIDATTSYTAVFDTSEGEVRVALDTKNTPKTANNFVVLSRYKFYDGTPIFRTDPGLDIIQGGGMSNTDSPGYALQDEGSGYTYKVGDLAMARTSAPNSAGSQWFFVTGPRAAVLDGQGTYVVFGKVIEGLDVVQRIISLNAGGVPSRTVLVNSVRIVES